MLAYIFLFAVALLALLSMQFAPHSDLAGAKLAGAQSLITADGLRHAPQFSATMAQIMWIVTVFVGLFVMLPSQMSVVDDFSRRWTDILWSASPRVRASLSGNQVKRVHYTILSGYVLWSFVCAYVFTNYGTPKLMTLVIANLNNLALGVTALHLLWINCTLLPPALRPRWYSRIGLILCGIFYLGLAVLVLVAGRK